MARDGRTKAIEKRKKKLKPGQAGCASCGEPMGKRTLRCPHCGGWSDSGKKAAAVAVAAIILLSAVLGYYLLPGSPGYTGHTGYPTVLSASPTGTSVPTTSPLIVTFDREMNRASVESVFSVTPPLPGRFTWDGDSLTYTPTQPMTAGKFYTVMIGNGATDLAGIELRNGYVWYFNTSESSSASLRSIGTGSEQFWDSLVDHPAWVENAVQTRPLLILTHSTGCAPCDAMMAICDPLSVEYAGQLIYFNITSSVDEPEATDSFTAYDPNGDPHYVPLTTIVTKGPGGSIIWHSWEGAFDEDTLVSWVDDAIEYHSLYG